MTVHTFGDLNEGDVVKVSLDGLYKVNREESWIRLESLEGHDYWTFELDEGDGWEIKKVAKDL